MQHSQFQFSLIRYDKVIYIYVDIIYIIIYIYNMYIAQMADKHVTLMRGKVDGIIAPSFTLGAANRCRWVF